jgi:acylphosphatase
MLKTIYFNVTGRVQGVFFRASTKGKADNYRLGGWVRNRADGIVEGCATGEEQSVNEFIKWLEHGPDMARVDKLIVSEIGHENFTEFSIR